MNYKYTTDGRKVVIVGNLNAAETIVQEVFVTTGGTEVPSGENFVVKSLHDAPVRSWKEDRIAELDAEYERRKAEMDGYRSKVSKAQKAAKLHAQALTAFASNAAKEQLSTVEDFVSGEITHFVLNTEYGAPRIRPFSDAITDVSEYDRDSIRLLSLFGRTNGDMEWRLHQYSDASGGSSPVIPAQGYEEAVSIVQARYDARVAEWRNNDSDKKTPPSEEWVKNVSELQEPDDVIEARKDRANAEREAKIARLESQIAELRQRS